MSLLNVRLGSNVAQARSRCHPALCSFVQQPPTFSLLALQMRRPKSPVLTLGVARVSRLAEDDEALLNGTNDPVSPAKEYGWMLEDLVGQQLGAKVTTQQFRELADVGAQRRDANFDGQSWQPFFSVGGDQLELREWICRAGHDMVVEQTKEVPDPVVFLAVVDPIGCGVRAFGGAGQLLEVVQKRVGVGDEELAVQDARKDASGAESVVELVVRGVPGIEKLALAEDENGAACEAGMGIGVRGGTCWPGWLSVNGRLGPLFRHRRASPRSALLAHEITSERPGRHRAGEVGDANERAAAMPWKAIFGSAAAADSD
ncbi:hypothetical protein L1887_56826 [Cichorium endivia]|nr:hypothetical protein L1887_56826 [Cichorium endivia]